MGKLDGKVAFITGASRGMGRSHAIVLAGEGAAVAALDVGEEDLNETVRQVRELGGQIIGLKADVRSDDEVKAAVDQTIKEFGHIDIVVANAGIIHKSQPFWEISVEDWQRVQDINLTGVWRTCKYTAPYLVAQRSGSVILIGSEASVRGCASLASYSASKMGVRGLMLTFAQELSPYDIRVNGVYPGYVYTPMTRDHLEMSGLDVEESLKTLPNDQLFPRFMEPKDISAGVLWLASDESRFVTGHGLLIDGGWAAK